MEHRLRETGFKDVKMVEEYLTQTKDSAAQIVRIIKDGKVKDLTIFETILREALDRARNENSRDLKELMIAAQRLQLFKTLEDSCGVIPLSDFCFNLSAASLIGTVCLAFSETPELLQSAIASVFKTLAIEIAANYEKCLHALPLECIEPSFLLKYLPPGSDANAANSPFWRSYSALHGGIPRESERLYLRIANEYIEELQLPGKALIILQEAAQRRGFIRLTKAGLQAVNMSYGIKELRELFKCDSSQEDVEILQGYFEKAKWIFVMDPGLYKAYMHSIIKYMVEVDQNQMTQYALGLLKCLLESQSSTALVFLKDQDLAQVVFRFILQSDYLTFKATQLLQDIVSLLQELTLAPPQTQYLKQYLMPQLALQADIFSRYKVETTFKGLQNLNLDRIKSLMLAVMDAAVKKSRNVKEKVMSKQKDRWLTLLQDLINLKASLAPDSDINVYQIFMQRLLDSRVTQSIDELIRSQMIPYEELQSSILAYLQEQYNHCDADQFYSFAQNSRQFLELLQKHETPSRKRSPLADEQKLLEVTFFLKQNSVLIGQMPFSQIRADFSQGKLIQRILQVHGFSEYPDHFQILAELQQIINPRDMQSVIAKVLKHLDTIKVFETPESKPEFAESMIEQLVINRDQLPADTAPILQKVTKITELPFKKRLLLFLLKHCDKREALYGDVCVVLASLMKEEKQTSFEDSLATALIMGMPGKAKYLIKQKYGSTPSEEVFLSIISECSRLSFSNAKILARQVLELESAERVKKLKSKWNDRDEFIRLFKNNTQIVDEPNKKKIETTLKQEEVQDPLDRLVNAKDLDEASMILEMDYSDWSGDLAVDQIISDMQLKNQHHLPHIALEAIVNKLSSSLPHLAPQMSALLALQDRGININQAVIVQDIPFFQEVNLQDGFKHHSSGLLLDSETPLMKEFRRVVTDTNILSLSLHLEPVSTLYPQLLALALYANKVSRAREVRTQRAQELLYGFLAKNLLEELIKTPHDAGEMLRTVNRNAKSPKAVIIE